MKLSEAIAGVELTMISDSQGHRARAVTPVSQEQRDVIERWGYWLAVWWRQSPTAILECDTCGEIRVVGAKKTLGCTRRGICQGTYRALEPVFTKPRPRRKKVQTT